MRRLGIFTILMVLSYSLGAFAAKPKSATTKNKVTSSDKWNVACDDLLKNSVKSTLDLEKSIAKRKKKLTRSEFDEKVQNELLVVQLNAWVCAVSSHDKVGAVVEEQFLKEYAEKVQAKRKL